jgi:hypothetical protein
MNQINLTTNKLTPKGKKKTARALHKETKAQNYTS